MAKDEALIKEVANDRMERLFALAEQETENTEGSSSILAKRYVGLIRRISTHYKIRLPRDIKNRICKNCNAFLIPGKTCSVRILNGSCIIYKCSCGRQKRVFLSDAKLV